MIPRYIVLFGDSVAHLEQSKLFQHGQLSSMSVVHASALLRVIAGPDAPFLRIPGFGLVIGTLYDDCGAAITHAADMGQSFAWSFDSLLQHTWGQYIAIQLGASDLSPLAVLRDPSGAVQCVYRTSSGGGFITSDISLAIALGVYRRRVDWQSIHHGLASPHLKTQDTMLAGVSELLPGNSLTCQPDRTSQASRWSPWRFVEADARYRDRGLAQAAVRSAVCTAISALVADKEKFIVELSGGLDSSIVSAGMGHAAQRAVFCTLAISVAGTDESGYARMVTNALQQPLHEVDVGTQGIDFAFPVSPDSVRPSIGAMENVINRTWEAEAARHGATTFFSGGGGDSVFCYLTTAAPAADAVLERGLRAGLTAIQELAILHECTIWKAMRLTLRKLRRKPSIGSSGDRRFLNPALPMPQPMQHPWLQAPVGSLPGDREKIVDLAGTQLFREITLRGAGRSICFPLLSQPVMEACLRVPSWMWIAEGRNRAIARDAFADLLPREIIQRRSKGSHISFMGAVYARRRHAMRRMLLDGALNAQGLLDQPALERFMKRDATPADLSFLRVFQLCGVENWVRHQLHST